MILYYEPIIYLSLYNGQLSLQSIPSDLMYQKKFDQQFDIFYLNFELDINFCWSNFFLRYEIGGSNKQNELNAKDGKRQTDNYLNGHMQGFYPASTNKKCKEIQMAYPKTTSNRQT